MNPEELQYYKERYNKDNAFEKIKRQRESPNEVIIRYKPVRAKKLKLKYNRAFPKKYNDYLQRAYTKGIEFEFSVEEFENMLSRNCHYCDTPNSNGIDKIDCKGGYTKSNCVPCCFPCNAAKFTFTTEEFLTQVAKIYNQSIFPLH